MSGKSRTSISGRFIRLAVACVAVAASTAGCGNSNATSGPNAGASSPATSGGCLVGISWNAVAGHIDLLQPSLVDALTAAGVAYEEKNAKATGEVQVAQIDEFVKAGVRVLVVEPSSDDRYLAAVERAIKAGIPVVAPVLPVEHALYVGFDPVEQGRQEAKALLAAKPKGTYAIIEGDANQALTKLIASGIHEILQPAVDRGDIRIVAEVQTPGWDSYEARDEMATILSQNGGSVDAVIAEESDQLGAGVEGALEDAGLSGKVAFAGGGTTAAAPGFYRLTMGKQTVEVWGNPQRIGVAAAQAVVALCHDSDITKVAGSASVTWPGRDPMQAILLAPVAVTSDNLSVVINADKYWWRVICDTGGRVYVAPPACPPATPSPPAGSASASLWPPANP